MKLKCITLKAGENYEFEDGWMISKTIEDGQCFHILLQYYDRSKMFPMTGAAISSQTAANQASAGVNCTTK